MDGKWGASTDKTATTNLKPTNQHAHAGSEAREHKLEELYIIVVAPAQ